MEKNFFLKRFSIDEEQEANLHEYIDSLKEHNMHTNLVGKSTLKNPWISHILDSLQVLDFVENKQFSILDIGTGAGLPGIVLSISGCKNVTLVDSNGKKVKFLQEVKKKINLSVNIILGRIEGLGASKFDVVTSRALAKLSVLLTYSQKFMKKNTVLIFLKVKAVNEELEEAKKKWIFDYRKHQSISDTRGAILVIKNIKKK